MVVTPLRGRSLEENKKPKKRIQVYTSSAHGPTKGTYRGHTVVQSERSAALPTTEVLLSVPPFFRVHTNIFLEGFRGSRAESDPTRCSLFV